MKYFLMWVFVGLLTNIYYFTTKRKEYKEGLKNNKYTYKDFKIGFVLTLFFFPVAIYNNEIRKKK